MDIHRCRFVPYQPHAINALAFSHTSNPKHEASEDLRLALGRENGDIEIWNPARGEWIQEKIFRGSAGRTIEQLAWTRDWTEDDGASAQGPKYGLGPLRLFSSGGSGSITEWDIGVGRPRRHAEGNFGDIWCFAAQPQWTKHNLKEGPARATSSLSPLIAAGCSDGSVILFSTADDDLRYDRPLLLKPARKTRVVSICWRDRNTVVAGYENSTIRVINVPNRQVLRQVSLPKSKDGTHAIVWSIRCLPDGTIISGDSTGELKVWDRNNYSLAQRLKTHDADVLDVTSNTAGTVLYSCGVDRRTVAYTKQTTARNNTNTWHRVMHRRYHDHDVKAIVAHESQDLSVAVSGGVDAALVVLPLQSWDREYHRTLTHLPQRPQMSVASQARMMLTWWDRELFVWQIPTKHDEEDSEQSTLTDASGSKRRLLARIQLSSEESLTAAAISPAGNLLVASTSVSVKLFQLRRSRGDLRTRPIEMSGQTAVQGASLVGFSPDGKWLYSIRPDNLVTLMRIKSSPTSHEPPKFHPCVINLYRKTRRPSKTGLGGFVQNINCAAFSSDSRILAAGDLSGHVDAWILEGHEDTGDIVANPNQPDGVEDESDSDSDEEDESFVVYGQKWIRNPAGSQLPGLDAAITAMSFRPSTAHAHAPTGVEGNLGLHATRHNHHPVSHEVPSADAGHLVVVTSSNNIVEFDVLACRLSDWSRRNPPSLLPSIAKQNKDRIMGIYFTSPQRLWLYCPNALFMVDTSQDFERTQPQTQKVGTIGSHIVEAAPQQAQKIVGHSRKRKRGMGAGNEMRDEQKYSATLIKQDSGLLSPTHDEQDVEMDDSDEPQDDTLVLTRRKEVKTETKQKYDPHNPALWSTYQYRNIYGVCVLDPRQAGGGESSEVVLVERPLYDVELMPRFANGQDW